MFIYQMAEVFEKRLLPQANAPYLITSAVSRNEDPCGLAIQFVTCFLVVIHQSCYLSGSTKVFKVHSSKR